MQTLANICLIYNTMNRPLICLQILLVPVEKEIYTKRKITKGLTNAPGFLYDSIKDLQALAERVKDRLWRENLQ